MELRAAHAQPGDARFCSAQSLLGDAVERPSAGGNRGMGAGGRREAHCAEPNAGHVGAIRGNFSSESYQGSAPTIEAVRHYTIKMMNGFATFKCLLCKHSVTTLEFSSQNGSCRTQAARAMNEHATVAHGHPSPISPRDAQTWSAHSTPISPEATKVTRLDQRRLALGNSKEESEGRWHMPEFRGKIQ